jgi:DNA polymerase III delta prime subunit
VALMIPPIMSLRTPPGEREVFNRLRDDPATSEWIVLHSLDIAEHPTQVSGEVDFVVIIPGRGVLVVEVKSHTVVHRGDDGLWYFGKDTEGEVRGPFRQASDAMHVLRRAVAEYRPALAGVPFWSAVVLPFASGRIVGNEWYPWQLIDSSRFRAEPLPYLLAGVLVHARALLISRSAVWLRAGDSVLTVEECRTIAAILRPRFEAFQSPAARARRLDEELKLYTAEQTEILDALAPNPRILVKGPAGTGKTLLAIESARRSVNEGRQTGLLCFNRHLGARLIEEARLVGGLSCAHIHKFMCDVAKVRPPANVSPAWWSDTLPDLAIDALLQSGEAPRFDEIVLDEFQDLLLPKYLDFLDLLVKGGLSAGRWRAFGDFARQSIYQTSAHVPIDRFVSTRSGMATNYELTANCRNLPRIVHHVHQLGRLNPHYRRIRRPDDGIDPQFHFYKDRGEQDSLLRRLFLKLESDGFHRRDIVVLSPLREGAAAALASRDGDGGRLRPYAGPGGSQAQWTTIHSFKGLEAPAIILTDIEDVDSPNAADLFYIGLTRSVQRLDIIAADSVASRLLMRLQSK